MTSTTARYDIHRDVTVAGGSIVIDRPEGRSALMAMNPDPDTVRCGDRWVETRSQRLGKHGMLWAVIAHQQDRLLVTAHTDPSAMAADYRQLSELVLGRPRGARIRRMDALNLLHRTAVNEHGASFHVGGLTFDAYTGGIWIELLDLGEDGEPIPGTECGVTSLEGWEIH